MINPIRMRPRVDRKKKGDRSEEVSKRVEVRAKGENKIEIFVDKANADLLGGTESALRLEDGGLRAREEREMRGETSIVRNKSSEPS